MRFKTKAVQSVAGLIVAVNLSSCGMLGKKEEAPTELKTESAQSGGCLNTFGPDFNSFLAGKADGDQWLKSWDCTIGSLATFQQFVQPSHPDGYTVEDMHSFISKFLVTNQEIPIELVRLSIELKASLLGGSTEMIRLNEIELLVGMLNVIKTETHSLIPYFATHAGKPSPQDLLKFGKALEVSLGNLGKVFAAPGKVGFPKKSLEQIIKVLNQVFGWKVPTGTLDLLFDVKRFVFKTSPEIIEGSSWEGLFSFVGRISGLGLSILHYRNLEFKNGYNAEMEHLLQLAGIGVGFLKEIAGRSGGVISFEEIFHFAQLVPDSMLKNVKRKTLEAAFKIAVQKTFFAKSPNGVDGPALDQAMEYATTFVRGKTYLERVFGDFRLAREGTSAEDFSAAARKLAEQLPESEWQSLYRLANLAKEYRPLFIGDESEVAFLPWTRHSLNNLYRLHGVNLAATILLKSYGSHQDPLAGELDDLRRLIDDYGELAFQLRILDPYIPGLYIKRFNEADLFTFASNGNGYMDIQETTNYLTFMVSGFSLSSRIRNDIEPICRTRDKDDLGWYWMEMDCFRREYLSRIGNYWDHMPNLAAYYRRLNGPQKEKLLNNMEKGFRRFGFSNRPVASYDVNGLAGYLHYIEAVFARFDEDNDETLDVQEALTALPVFKLLLSKALTSGGGKPPPIKPEKLLEAAFTYVLKYGRRPVTNFGGTMHFLWWMARKPFWSFRADRGKLYSIVPILLGGPAPKSSGELPYEDLIELSDPEN